MNPVKFWYFYDAPQEYQNLSNHGGDEDFLAYVPKEQLGIFSWLEDRLGICCTSRHDLPNGDAVIIGAHA